MFEALQSHAEPLIWCMAFQLCRKFLMSFYCSRSSRLVNSSGGLHDHHEMTSWQVQQKAISGMLVSKLWDHFVYAPSQWEMTLQCIVVSHWLGARTEWSLKLVKLNKEIPATEIKNCVLLFVLSSLEWVIKFNSLSRVSGQRGPYSPYKLCNHGLCIGIIIFPHVDNTQSTGHLKKKDIKNETQKSEGTH